MAEEEDLIEQINNGLSRYYNKCNEDNDYFNDENNNEGWFKYWCNENGFDEDGVLDELRNDPTKCLLCDQDGFDFDDFPFVDQDDANTANQDDDVKKRMIFNVISKCSKEPDAYKDKIDTFKPLEVTPSDWKVNDQEIEETKEMYEKQLNTIWDNEAQNDKSLIKLLTIGRKLDKNVLQLLTDTWMRDRIEYSIKKGNMVTERIWAENNKFMKRLIKEKDKYGQNAYQDAKTSLSAFSNRICPILQLHSNTVIDDSIEKISEYILSIVNFTYKIANDKELSCPFQADHCIIFNNVVGTEQKSTIPKIDDNDDDDDDDDDDEDEEDIDNDQKEQSDDFEFYDTVGDIKKKLQTEKLLYIDTTIDDTNYSKIGVTSSKDLLTDSNTTTTSRFPHQFNEFKNNILSKKYKDDEFIRYPQKKRFCCVIDRRLPQDKDGDDNNANDDNKKKDEDFLTESDEIIFFEPPDCCNKMPNKHVPEWYFDSSKTCIIPYIGFNNTPDRNKIRDDLIHSQKDKEMKQVIASTSHCKGALITLSFHVESSEEIRAYLYINGQVTRFMPKDVIHLLPRYFIKSDENLKWIQSEEAKNVIRLMKPKLRDLNFESFYQKYRNTIN